jgi:hypothetical protein
MAYKKQRCGHHNRSRRLTTQAWLIAVRASKLSTQPRTRSTGPPVCTERSDSGDEMETRFQQRVRDEDKELRETAWKFPSVEAREAEDEATAVMKWMPRSTFMGV